MRAINPNFQKKNPNNPNKLQISKRQSARIVMRLGFGNLKIPLVLGAGDLGLKVP